MPDFWPRFLFALLYKFINGDTILFVAGFLGGVLPMYAWRFLARWALDADKHKRAWLIWFPVCLLAGIAGAIAMHNAWEWWVVNVLTKPLGEPLNIHTGKAL